MKSQTLPQVRLHTSYQMLVNQSHPLPSLAVPELAAPDPACPDVLMERHAAALLSACIRAVNGAGKIIPVSGWRSHEEQQQIWDDTLAKEGPVFTRNYVAFPGCSEHESGLAIDLALAAPEIDFIRPEFPYTGVCGEFRRLAPRYGFVERYRAEKQSITGIAAEPWHFRYVGVPHAQLMEEYGLCLEEYLELLRHRSLQFRSENGRRAKVQYLPNLSALPDNASGYRQLSLDNAGGIILTQWEGFV